MSSGLSYSNIYTHSISVRPDCYIYHWICHPSFVFEEMILSWNGTRPREGSFIFSVRFKIKKEWSSWIELANWGKGVQRFAQKGNEHVQVDVDTLLLKYQGSAFEVRVEGRHTSLAELRYMYVFVSNPSQKNSSSITSLKTLHLESFPSYSQMVLPHPRAHHLCSPTSTCAVIHYLNPKTKDLKPESFAELAYDQQHDVYGNWVLNVAEASSLLGPSFMCRVERLKDFSCIHALLSQKCPVVVSIKGPLAGGAQEYQQGHLLVIIGWNEEKKCVMCMDPAFPSPEKTFVSYRYQDFIQAWQRRGQIAYIFQSLERPAQGELA